MRAQDGLFGSHWIGLLLSLFPNEFAKWKKAKVNIDYHIQVDHHYYSVPYNLVREQVDVRLTAGTVEVLYRGKRVASHQRIRTRSPLFSTKAEHMPEAHQKHLEWSLSRISRWAKTVGPKTAELVTGILDERPFPEQGYRSFPGILRLEKHYSKERVEAAAQRALARDARSYKYLASIPKSGLEQVPLEQPVDPPVVQHSNVRGPEYYTD